MLKFKFVETSTVTDETLEQIVNEFVSQGWNFEGIHFAMRDTSKRPAMAFVTFTRDIPEGAPDDPSGEVYKVS
ncbi:MAG: hypothetical protein GMKNLPBB_01094 [Myxococcota bacterium]|nr:hypothetical protein [Myxococcota bacterium]